MKKTMQTEKNASSPTIVNGKNEDIEHASQIVLPNIHSGFQYLGADDSSVQEDDRPINIQLENSSKFLIETNSVGSKRKKKKKSKQKHAPQDLQLGDIENELSIEFKQGDLETGKDEPQENDITAAQT